MAEGGPGQGLRDFVSHVHSLKHVDPATGLNGFAREFLHLKEISNEYQYTGRYPSTVGAHPGNLKKNRYKDIIPFDHSRCVLAEIPGEEGSDYINASYIKGTSERCSVIAAQGPMSVTVDDFWRMVWSHHVRIIVMCCRVIEAGRQKCRKYWPALGSMSTFGPITVYHEKREEPTEDYMVNTFHVTCNGETRIITHFHYVTWPDHGVPRSPVSVMRMLASIRDLQPNDDVPIVIHCSAGCGRTGSLTAIDYTWQLLKEKGLDASFDIFETVARLRQQRLAMVQTTDQYLFVYKAVLDLVKNVLEGVRIKQTKAPAPVEEPLYVDMSKVNSQAKTIAPARIRALSELTVPTVDGYLQDEKNDEAITFENPPVLPIVEEEQEHVYGNLPGGAAAATGDKETPRQQVLDFGDLTFPSRVPRPQGPRKPPAWFNYRLQHVSV
eukprot:m.7489 g.7489  ORF g.7489 m.7489 type:complete len:438 (-) comp2950_c0_seq2:30-1343(-)